jgi:hypothetical protein
MRRKHNGFILLLAVGAMGVISLAVTRALSRLIVFNHLQRTFIDREQAKLLAWSGVQIAIAQLQSTELNEDKLTKGSEEERQKFLEKMVRIPLEAMNSWQKKEFTEATDGVEGICTFYIACENGKINAEDFAKPKEKQKNVNPTKPTQTPIDKAYDGFMKLAANKIGKTKYGTVNILAELMKLRAKRGHPFDDISELFEDEQFRPLASILYPVPGEEQFALSDFLSFERTTEPLSIWLLSRAVAHVLNLKRVTKISDAAWKELSALLLSGMNGDTIKKITQLLYGKNHTPIPPEIMPLLSPKFESNLFSVVSYGSYNKIVVKLYVLIKRARIREGDQETLRFFVHKVIWLS